MPFPIGGLLIFNQHFSLQLSILRAKLTTVTLILNPNVNVPLTSCILYEMNPNKVTD